MNATMSGCMAVICATMFAACAVDSAPDQSASPDTNRTMITSEAASDLTAPGSAEQVIHVPPALAMDQIENLEISGNDATTNACHVTLEFCNDPTFGGPTYRQSGCTLNAAFNAAHSLCTQVCGHINCNAFNCDGSCGS